MSQVAETKKTLPEPFRFLYQPIEQELQDVEQMLCQQLQSSDAAVDRLLRYSFRIGGKRLRPALLLLAGKAVGKTTPDHIVLATVMEMIHTATLVHDDVLDEAALRRHIDTVNARWNNESSVLLGDFLFTHSFYLASTLESTYACRTIGRATNIVCDGELRQVQNRGNLNLSEQGYLQIIEAKTAELCASCCQLGAHYAGADSHLESQLESFGRHLGIAFQIVDDLLDVLGDEETTGKSLGSDLEKQKLTLPLIRVLECADAAQREEIVCLLSGDRADAGEAIVPWIERFEAVEYAREKARWHAHKALEGLADLPPSDATDVLRSLTEFVLIRQS